MRVMHVIDQLGIGGAERCLVEIALASQREGMEVSVCATRGGGAMEARLPARVPFRNLGRRSRWELSATTKFSEWVRERRADVLHVHGRSSLLFVAASRRLGRLPTPALLHDHYGDGNRSAWVLRLCRDAITRYVASSPRLEQSAWKAGVPRGRTETISASLPLSRFSAGRKSAARARLGLPPHAVAAVAVGGLRSQKGYDILLQALAGLNAPTNFRVYLLGGVRDAAYARRLRGQARALALSDRIVFLGERTDTDDWLAAADFSVHAARVESGPLALIEQMAAGLPTVCTRVGAVAAIAEESGAEGFVNPEDPASLRSEMERLLSSSREERRARGGFGRRIAEQKFDLNRRFDQWKSAYLRAARDA